MLGRDAARRYAQDSAVLSSPRCFSAQISRNAIGWSLPICGLSEVKQVINSGHRRALVKLMHQLYPCFRFVLYHFALLSADANRKAQNAVRSTLYCCMALSPQARAREPWLVMVKLWFWSGYLLHACDSSC